MIRMICEWRNPVLKCGRLGHLPRDCYYRGFEYPSIGFRCVADQVEGTMTVCSRCGQVIGRTVEHCSGVNSLGLDSDDWRALKRDGFVEVRRG